MKLNHLMPTRCPRGFESAPCLGMCKSGPATRPQSQDMLKGDFPGCMLASNPGADIMP